MSDHCLFAKAPEQQYPLNKGIYILRLPAPTVVQRLGDTNNRANQQALLTVLENEHQAVLNKISAQLGRSIQSAADYKMTFNGMALKLTEEEFIKLNKLSDIGQLQADVLYPLATDVGPNFIGAGEIWNGNATPAGVGTLGEGMLVGILDTGINHDHPSFSETPSDGYSYTNPNGQGQFIGWCNPAHPNFVSGFCNNKLVGAWDFADSLGGNESDGPEDGNGHGSHTSSTVAGNTLDGSESPTPRNDRIPMSGVAPHANIIIYDVCGASGCPGAAILAAIDQATLDGVDVINFSISGGLSPWQDADRSFLDAITSGVFVAASAGNTSTSVPNPIGTVNHRGPWMMTVAASTHNRSGQGDVLAGFSLRGPNETFDVIKPDITAPGVSIYAAYSTPTEYAHLDGTSMSSPHTAGSATLVRKLHPDWSVAEVKSAIMMTANQNATKENGTTPADPDDIGAGRVELRNAALAGLVMDITRNEYLAADPAINGLPKQLNLPSLANRLCVNQCSWTRTVTNKSGSSHTWNSSFTAPTGINFSITPSSFTLNDGESQQLNITANISSTSLNSVEFANIAFDESGNSLPQSHWPVVLGGFYGVIPDNFSHIVVADSESISIDNLTSGAHNISALAHSMAGMVNQSQSQFSLNQDPTNGDPFDNLADVFVQTVNVPANATRLIAHIIQSQSPDLDMFVGFDGNGNGPESGEILCTSATGTALERCDLRNPQEGSWWIVVQNWSGSAQQPDASTLSYAVVGKNDDGNVITTGPAVVQPNTAFNVSLDWNEKLFYEDNARWYGVLLLGTDAGLTENVAQIPVDFISDRIKHDDFEE
ncbi:MAG: S8 family serine peptidase [bacterium]